MKVIFDEGVPEALEGYLTNYQISTVKREGWCGTRNGRLLDLVEGAGFDAFITSDKRMERDQNLLCWLFAIPGLFMKVDCGMFVPK